MDVENPTESHTPVEIGDLWSPSDSEIGDTYKGSAHIRVEIQHKDPFLADKGAIEHVLAVPDSVVPFDRANVPQQPRGAI